MFLVLFWFFQFRHLKHLETLENQENFQHQTFCKHNASIANITKTFLQTTYQKEIH